MDNQILLPLVLFCGAPLERERERGGERAALKQVKKTDAMSEKKNVVMSMGHPVAIYLRYLRHLLSSKFKKKGNNQNY